MSHLKVALLQLLPHNTIEQNLSKGIDACRRAKAMDADIALFPEMWNCGYTIPEDVECLNCLSIGSDSHYIHSFQALARELNMAIAVTYLEEYEPMPRNTVCLIDRFGKKVFTYAKVHTCVFGDEARLTAGDEFYVGDLDTEKGNVKIGDCNL